MLKPKTDVKGFDFKKATTSREAEAYFTKLIDDYIMGDEIDAPAILKGLRDYSKVIEDSIRSGEVTYLPNTSAKELSQYKDPSTQQSVKGMLVWNALYPAKRIDIPSKPKLLKLNIFTPDDLDLIRKDYPEEARIINNLVFNDNTGIFVTYKDGVKKGEKIKIRKDAGCAVICIPANEPIPKWCMPYIDYDVVIDNILAPFKAVVEIIGIQNFQIGKMINGVNRKSDKISNIVKF